MNDLEKFMTENENKEVIIFKFSPICGISRSVERDFNTFLNHNPEIPVLRINVIAQRNLSREIATTYKIFHESPQLIWFDKNHQVNSHASHYEISDLLDK